MKKTYLLQCSVTVRATKLPVQKQQNMTNHFADCPCKPSDQWHWHPLGHLTLGCRRTVFWLSGYLRS